MTNFLWLSISQFLLYSSWKSSFLFFFSHNSSFRSKGSPSVLSFAPSFKYVLMPIYGMSAVKRCLRGNFRVQFLLKVCKPSQVYCRLFCDLPDVPSGTSNHHWPIQPPYDDSPEVVAIPTSWGADNMKSESTFPYFLQEMSFVVLHSKNPFENKFKNNATRNSSHSLYRVKKYTPLHSRGSPN